MCFYTILWNGGDFPWVLVESGFFREEECSLDFGFLRSGGYIVLVHAFIGGVRISSDAAWIKMKSMFYQDCDFSWTAGLEYFQTQLASFSLHYHVFFLCINIV